MVSDSAGFAFHAPFQIGKHAGRLKRSCDHPHGQAQSEWAPLAIPDMALRLRGGRGGRSARLRGIIWGDELYAMALHRCSSLSGRPWNAPLFWQALASSSLSGALRQKAGLLGGDVGVRPSSCDVHREDKQTSSCQSLQLKNSPVAKTKPALGTVLAQRVVPLHSR